MQVLAKRREPATPEQDPKEPEQPWKGKCSPNCWNATGERCRCSCEGKSHGMAKKLRGEKKQRELKDFLKKRGLTDLDR